MEEEEGRRKKIKADKQTKASRLLNWIEPLCISQTWKFRAEEEHTKLSPYVNPSLTI